MSIRVAFCMAWGTILCAGLAVADDWPMFGRDQTRNMVSPEKNPPTDWQIEIRDSKSGAVTARAKNIKWQAELGTQSMGSPVVADGLVRVVHEDLFKADLAGADVVALYLLPALNKKLIPQLEKMKPRGRVVSHAFPIEGIQPEQVIPFVSTEDGLERSIYLYTTPLKKEAPRK